MESVKNALKKVCHDCGKKIQIKEDKIINGKQLFYNLNDEKIAIFKCNDCYEKDKSLKNFQSCEVYSRVVGYIRPVQQWNEGKEREYKEREEYKVK